MNADTHRTIMYCVFSQFDTGYMFRPFRQDTHEKRKYFFKKALAFFVNIWYHIGALVEGAI